MKRIFVIVLAGMLLLSACGTADVSSANGTGVEAHDFWARAALKDGTSAAYMLLSNGTAQDDALIGASSNVAAAVEVHLSKMGDDGTMQMIPQESVALPAGGELELKPGSYHIMLIGLVKDLNVGDEITVTLNFENAEDVTLTIPVKEAADMGGSGMDVNSMDMGASTISIEGAWGRLSPKVATAGAFYMVIKNSDSEADKLTGASSEACNTVELHESYLTPEGAMGMRAVEGGYIEIPANGMTELKVGGLHIMCIDKKDEFFAVGSMIDVTLQFENAGEISAVVEIREQQ